MLDNVPRMLSWIDRRPGSPTYGCSDRNYWHYKIVDFPCSMLQETTLTLALLYSTNFRGNRYYKMNYIKKLALAQIHYWNKIQNKNGSFDEFYPNEESFSSTAFTLYAICKAQNILEENLELIRKTCKKSCEFLLEYGDPGASNQIASAIAAINQYSILYNDKSFENRLNRLLESFIDSQNAEGWTPEYGGFDVGYQSITLAYLTDYNDTQKKEEVSNSIKKMIEFLSNFIHPDGTVGGEYGSRSTTFFVPYGFLNNSDSTKLGNSILNKVFLEPDTKINHSIDDRYICHFILPSYLLSINKIKFNIDTKLELPYKRNFNRMFNDSGIFISSTSDYYFITNFKKGGVFNLYGKKRKKKIIDSGYVIKDLQKIYVSNWLGKNVSFEMKEKEKNLMIYGEFFWVLNKVPTPFYHFCLRILSFFGGRIILPFLKKIFINSERKTGVKFRRNFIFNKDQIEVIDRFRLRHNISPENISMANPNSTFRYVAPSNYFQNIELTDSLDFNNNLKIDDNKILFKRVIDITNFKYLNK